MKDNNCDTMAADDPETDDNMEGDVEDYSPKADWLAYDSESDDLEDDPADDPKDDDPEEPPRRGMILRRRIRRVRVRSCRI